MAARSTMLAMIARVRIMINDLLPAGSGQVFTDNDVQNVLDETRQDVYNMPLLPQPTFSGATIQWLDYLAPSQLGDWEDDIVLKQYLTVVVTPATIDDIVGHYTFAASTFPPVYITGKTFDIFRASADLLERWAAKWVLMYSISVDGQHLRLNEAADAQQKLAKTYRTRQRAGTITMRRTDIAAEGAEQGNVLGPRPIDYMASG